MRRSGSAVVDRAERDAVVVRLEQRVAEREDLEAAGVGEDRAVPAHERVQAAELGDQLLARAGNGGGTCCRARSRRRARAARPGSTDFTVAFVPTGMKAGVRTSPCAVRSTPARAAPSRAVTVKHLAHGTSVDGRDPVLVSPSGRSRAPALSNHAWMREAISASRAGSRASQLVLADPAELGDERALRRVAAEQRRDADGVAARTRRAARSARARRRRARSPATRSRSAASSVVVHRLDVVSVGIEDEGADVARVVLAAARRARRCRGIRPRSRRGGTRPRPRRRRPGRRDGGSRSAAARPRRARSDRSPPRRETSRSLVGHLEPEHRRDGLPEPPARVETADAEPEVVDRRPASPSAPAVHGLDAVPVGVEEEAAVVVGVVLRAGGPARRRSRSRRRCLRRQNASTSSRDVRGESDVEMARHGMAVVGLDDAELVPLAGLAALVGSPSSVA